MKKKPTFAKTPSLLYKNMSKNKDRDYVGYINERNEEDQRFYDTRKKIVQKSFETFMLPYLKDLMQKNPHRSIECLDIGCGDGVVLDALNTLGKKHSFKLNLHGLDLDKDALKSIKYRANLVVASALDMPFPDNNFDLITSSQTLEHFTEKDLKTTLKDTYRVLNKSGYFYAETPNPESLLAVAMGKDWWMYLEEHLVLIPPAYMEKIMSEIGFKNIKVKTRMEVDEQINELSEIIVRQRSFYHKVIPVRVKAKVIKIYANLFRKGAVLVAVAQK